MLALAPLQPTDIRVRDRPRHRRSARREPTSLWTSRVPEKLTGHLSSPMFGEEDLTGTTVAPFFEFSISGDACMIPFKGVIEEGSLKGSFENPGVGNGGTFTGKREP